MTARRLRCLIAICVLVSSAPLSGCATVHPWERGALAHRCIRWAPAPDVAALRQHVLTVRESAQGGHGSAGGGCGCD